MTDNRWSCREATFPLRSLIPGETAKSSTGFRGRGVVAGPPYLPITSRALIAQQWNSSTETLILQEPEEATAARFAYHKKGLAWQETPQGNAAGGVTHPEVILEEDLNTPPHLYLWDARRKRKTLLLDLNPQFSRLSFGRVEEIRWTATDGHEVVGGLYLPPDCQPGVRYPLVIQTHGFNKDRFWIDGPFSSAFAAQPLAAKGSLCCR